MDQEGSDKRVVVGLHLVGVFVHENESCLAKDRSNWATGRPLPPRLDLARYPPQFTDPALTYGWGYAGRGPRILAASLIFDVTGSEDLARQLYVALAFGFVAFLKDKKDCHAPFLASYEEVAIEIAACADDRKMGRPIFGAPYAIMPGP